MRICSHLNSGRHWAAFTGYLVTALLLLACGAEGEMNGHDGDDPLELSALGLALEEDKKASGHGRPLHLRRVSFNGQAMIPHPPIDDPRLMFVSGFDELPEDKPDAADGDRPAEEAQDITGELDPSGVFEVRETGFLPPPILRLERADARRLTIAWDAIQGADGYVVTILHFGSDGAVANHFQRTIRGTETDINTDGHRVLIAVRSYSTAPFRRSEFSNKIGYDPSDP